MEQKFDSFVDTLLCKRVIVFMFSVGGSWFESRSFFDVFCWSNVGLTSLWTKGTAVICLTGVESSAVFMVSKNPAGTVVFSMLKLQGQPMWCCESGFDGIANTCFLVLSETIGLDIVPNSWKLHSVSTVEVDSCGLVVSVQSAVVVNVLLADVAVESPLGCSVLLAVESIVGLEGFGTGMGFRSSGKNNKSDSCLKSKGGGRESFQERAQSPGHT